MSTTIKTFRLVLLSSILCVATPSHSRQSETTPSSTPTKSIRLAIADMSFKNGDPRLAFLGTSVTEIIRIGLLPFRDYIEVASREEIVNAATALGVDNKTSRTTFPTAVLSHLNIQYLLEGELQETQGIFRLSAILTQQADNSTPKKLTSLTLSQNQLASEPIRWASEIFEVIGRTSNKKYRIRTLRIGCFTDPGSKSPGEAASFTNDLASDIEAKLRDLVIIRISRMDNPSIECGKPFQPTEHLKQTNLDVSVGGTYQFAQQNKEIIVTPSLNLRNLEISPPSRTIIMQPIKRDSTPYTDIRQAVAGGISEELRALFQDNGDWNLTYLSFSTPTLPLDQKVAFSEQTIKEAYTEYRKGELTPARLLLEKALAHGEKAKNPIQVGQASLLLGRLHLKQSAEPDLSSRRGGEWDSLYRLREAQQNFTKTSEACSTLTEDHRKKHSSSEPLDIEIAHICTGAQLGLTEVSFYIRSRKPLQSHDVFELANDYYNVLGSPAYGFYARALESKAGGMHTSPLTDGQQETLVWLSRSDERMGRLYLFLDPHEIEKESHVLDIPRKTKEAFARLIKHDNDTIENRRFYGLALLKNSEYVEAVNQFKLAKEKCTSDEECTRYGALLVKDIENTLRAQASQALKSGKYEEGILAINQIILSKESSPDPSLYYLRADLKGELAIKNNEHTQNKTIPKKSLLSEAASDLELGLSLDTNSSPQQRTYYENATKLAPVQISLGEHMKARKLASDLQNTLETSWTGKEMRYDSSPYAKAKTLTSISQALMGEEEAAQEELRTLYKERLQDPGFSKMDWSTKALDAHIEHSQISLTNKSIIRTILSGRQ